MNRKTFLSKLPLLATVPFLPTILPAQGGRKGAFALWDRETLTEIEIPALSLDDLAMIDGGLTSHLRAATGRRESVYIVADKYVYGGSKTEMVALRIRIRQERRSR